MIRVYGIPGCSPCEVAKMFLKQKGAEFEFVDVSQDLDAQKKLSELLGSPSAGVLLEAGGNAEALRGVSIGGLEAWYQRFIKSRQAR